MAEEIVGSLQNPVLNNLKLAGERQPERQGDITLPEGITVVSADAHWEISTDIFYEGFPQRLKDKAPRVWHDRYWHIGYPGTVEAYGTSSATLDNAIEKTIPSGVWDGALRAAHMKIEGVEKEIVFPQSLLGFIRYKDLEVQEWIYRVYNEYIAERSHESGGRFNGVGICSNWWDPSKAASAIQQIVDLDLKTFLIPVSPGKNSAGKEISYADSDMDPFWEAVSESGLPVNFHVGENAFIQEGPGALGTYMMTAISPFRKPFGQLVFGGVFDRHPSLKVVFAEGGLCWIPAALQDAEMVFDTFTELLTPMQHRPSHYWHKNCYATFQNDILGLNSIEHIGIDRVMWANDYPHTEGSFGLSWSSMKSVSDIVQSPAHTRLILGDTATALYGL